MRELLLLQEVEFFFFTLTEDAGSFHHWQLLFVMRDQCFKSVLAPLLQNTVQVWSGESPDLRFYVQDLASGSGPALRKCSCVGDLPAQASGQALIRGCESTGSASRSVFSFYELLCHSLIRHSPSPSVFICSLQICQFLLSSPSGFASSLISSEGRESLRSLSPWQRRLFSSG